MRCMEVQVVYMEVCWQGSGGGPEGVKTGSQEVDFDDFGSRDASSSLNTYIMNRSKNGHFDRFLTFFGPVFDVFLRFRVSTYCISIFHDLEVWRWSRFGRQKGVKKVVSLILHLLRGLEIWVQKREKRDF